MQPTKEQWQALEDGLFGAYGRAELRVDGYEITLQKQLVSESKLAIMVYVDGWFRGEWVTIDCEERRRFMRPISGYVLNAKARREIKTIPKRYRSYDPDKKLTSWSCFWPTFTPLRRHLARENESIEILTINGEACHD